MLKAIRFGAVGLEWSSGLPFELEGVGQLFCCVHSLTVCTRDGELAQARDEPLDVDEATINTIPVVAAAKLPVGTGCVNREAIRGNLGQESIEAIARPLEMALILDKTSEGLGLDKLLSVASAMHHI